MHHAYLGYPHWFDFLHLLGAVFHDIQVILRFGKTMAARTGGLARMGHMRDMTDAYHGGR